MGQPHTIIRDIASIFGVGQGQAGVHGVAEQVLGLPEVYRLVLNTAQGHGLLVQADRPEQFPAWSSPGADHGVGEVVRVAIAQRGRLGAPVPGGQTAVPQPDPRGPVALARRLGRTPETAVILGVLAWTGVEVGEAREQQVEGLPPLLPVRDPAPAPRC